MEISLSPKDFIMPPYCKCPHCGEIKFGVLSIGDSYYTRRCAECLFPQGNDCAASFPLPPLKKVMIHLDINLISNMVKALDLRQKGHENTKKDPRWLEAFKKLDRLSKLQLICCIESNFHDEEGMPSGFYDPIRTMYEQLSQKIGFFHESQILKQQIYAHAEGFVKGRSGPIEIRINRAVHGNINGWKPRLLITTRSKIDSERISKIEAARDAIDDLWRKVFSNWQQDSKFDFERHFNMEVQEFGKGLLQGYIEALKKIDRLFKGDSSVGVDVLMDSTVQLVSTIRDLFISKYHDEGAALKCTFEYFSIADFSEVPAIRISAAMYAGIARKAALDKRMKTPTRGMVADIRAISTVMPYCDAIFVDDFCRSLLTENPVKDKLNLSTRIFSKSSIDDFFVYLDDIEAKAGKEHLDLVREVYGPEWEKPYTEIFK